MACVWYIELGVGDNKLNSSTFERAWLITLTSLLRYHEHYILYSKLNLQELGYIVYYAITNTNIFQKNKQHK